ncbi:MAG: hypothetical protein QN168_06335 [Armatimonadota bacterium]|nr:hypothetical protein [Armatimonadota bacterium]
MAIPEVQGDRPWFRFYEPGVPRPLEFPTHAVYGFLDHSASR